jgi:hypothetical protein
MKRRAKVEPYLEAKIAELEERVESLMPQHEINQKLVAEVVQLRELLRKASGYVVHPSHPHLSNPDLWRRIRQALGEE